MNQNEFLSMLREALENELSGQAVQENVQYYKTYIDEEIRNGRTEEEVLAELGDPWLIAKTIITSPHSGQERQTIDDTPFQRENAGRESKVHVFGLDTWWKKLLAALAVIGVIAAIIAIITGVLSLIAPILIPVLLIVIIMKIFREK